MALALDIGDTKRDYTISLGLNIFCLTNPGSITNTTPSIVSDVYAILVETISLRLYPFPSFLVGGGSNIFCCYLGGRAE